MSDPHRLMVVGRVAGAFGVKGEVRIRAYTDDPMTLLAFRTLSTAEVQCPKHCPEHCQVQANPSMTPARRR